MATTTSTATAAARQPARLAAEDAFPKGLVVLLGLIVSLAVTIALTFWLASDVHPAIPVHGAPAAAE
jgi:hypothetical protein